MVTIEISDPKILKHLEQSSRNNNDEVLFLLNFALQTKEMLSYKMNLEGIENIIKESMSKEKEAISEIVCDLRGKVKVSANKGSISESIISENIQKNFPECEILDTTKMSHESDLRMRQEGKPDIIIEVKNYKTNVPTSQIDKFKRDLETVQDVKYGILVSTGSGISRKKKMGFEHHNDKMIIYIPNSGFDGIAITWAILFIHNTSMASNESSRDINFKRLMDVKKNIINMSNLSNDITKMRIEFNNTISTIQNTLLSNSKNASDILSSLI